jgi:hypothetical protein
MTCSAVEGFLAPLQPAAQALHDQQFVEAIDHASEAFQMAHRPHARPIALANGE